MYILRATLCPLAVLIGTFALLGRAAAALDRAGHLPFDEGELPPATSGGLAMPFESEAA